MGGTVSGLAGSGLVLQNNAGDDLAISTDGSFTFATGLDDGSDYAVSVLTQPSSPSQTCSVTNGSGTLAGANVTDVTVSCVTGTFTVGGTVSGLAGSGLVLQNNAGDDLAVSASGSFTFATALNDGSDYAVSVLTQPISLSQTCSVTNGSSTLAGASVTDVTVSCVTGTFTVGGTVSGLAGSGLVLQNNVGDDLAISTDGSFTFATGLDDGSDYAVSVLTQPTNPNQTCSVTNGSSTLAGANVTDVTVSCVTGTFTVGGTVSGLAGSGLVLQNNAGDDLAISTDGSFTFATGLDDGSDYAVSVLTQPSSPSQTCSVTNGSSTLAGASVTDVTVSCVTGTRVFMVKTAFDDKNPRGVTVFLTCDGVAAIDITPAQGTATSDNAASFTVSNFPTNDTTCTATETVPVGYTYSNPAACTGIRLVPDDPLQGGSCTLINSQNPVTVRATKNFTDDADIEITLVMACPEGGTVTTIDGTATNGTAAVFEVADFLWNGTVCNITEPVVPDGYYIEVTTCENLRITPNDDATLCTITNDDIGPAFQINAGNAGAWFNTATSGQGQFIDVEPEEQFMFISWFTFTGATSDNPFEQHWFTAQGNYTGNTAELTLYETLGGAFDDPQEINTLPVGEVTLSFNDCDQGQMTYSFNEEELQGTVPLFRVIPGSGNVCEELSGNTTKAVDINAGMDGAWFDTNTPGQGFFIDSHPDPEGGNFIFVSWFTYGEDTASGQRWLTAQGSFEGSLAEIDVFETTGGSFDDPQPPSTIKVGSMSLNFTDCSNAQLTYSLTDSGAEGDIAITRVIPAGQALCEDLVGAD